MRSPVAVSGAVRQENQTHWAVALAREALGALEKGGDALLDALSSAFISEAHATPQYARETKSNCTQCHILPPKLNETGEAFLARGYRLPADIEATREGDEPSTVPVAIWITGRHERQLSKDFNKTFIPKVELISGGRIGTLPLSYFVEWRTVSLSAKPDGTLGDRGGRFEDAFVNLELGGRHLVRAGQFRVVNQSDVSRRLSLSEPALLSGSIPGSPDPDKRIQSLGAFSPSGRSPSVAYAFQSITGAAPSDGLFHIATLPFVGELSIPLSTEARKEASPELSGPKGVFLETFYRSGLNTAGVHAFIDTDRWLVSGLGTFSYSDLHATAGFGVDGGDMLPMRQRYSAELEYLPTWSELFRPGLGFRFEYIKGPSDEPAYIPYFVVSGPNLDYSFLVQLEGRIQEGSKAVIVDASIIF